MPKVDQRAETVYVGARAPAALATAFEQVASGEDRTVSGELRRFIRQRVEAAPKLARPPAKEGGPRDRAAVSRVTAAAASGRKGGRAQPPTYAFGFLDETGTLGGQRDPFFAVGLLRCREPYLIQRPIQRIRDQHHFYDEIKWSQVSAKKLPELETILNVFFGDDATFSAFIAEKAKHDVIGRFGGPFQAYEALARQLVHGVVRQRETLWIVADEYPSPAGTSFEENVRDYVNKRCQGRPVAGVCRMRSHGTDMLQLTDLLLGAVVYEYKSRQGLASYKPKLRLLDHIKRRAGVATFIGGHRDGRFNVQEYGS